MTDVSVTELRLVVTAENYPEALAFYRDVLGLAQLAEFDSPDGHVGDVPGDRPARHHRDPLEGLRGRRVGRRSGR